MSSILHPGAWAVIVRDGDSASSLRTTGPLRKRPLVDRHVGVHVVAVEHGHLAQRVHPVELALLVEVVEGGGLPCGAVALLDAATLDDPEQAVAVDGIDAPEVQPAMGDG